jgi:Flp pilus assembly protein TadG
MRSTQLRSEEGAILVQVAVGILVLIALTTFVYDYGVMWVARRQAQNAADAGALSGAVSLALDPNGAANGGAEALDSALTVAASNNVWGEAPDAAANNLNAFYPVACPDGTATCLRVDVYRNPARGNALPMFFGRFVGLTEQGVRATAMAQAAVANASDCLKPWAIPDRWNDNHDETGVIDNEWTMDDRFETTYESGPNKGQPLPTPDTYSRPGFTLQHVGTRMTLKFGNPSGSQPIAPGNYFPVALPTWDGESRGGSDYEENIARCNGVPVAIDSEITSEPGAMIGPTRHGMEDLIALDPLATWDEATQSVQNSCAQSASPCATISPRIVAIPIFDTGWFHEGQQTGRIQLRIVNILGFFIDQMQGQDVTGVFMRIPGVMLAGAGANVNPSAAFMQVPILVR